MDVGVKGTHVLVTGLTRRRAPEYTSEATSQVPAAELGSRPLASFSVSKLYFNRFAAIELIMIFPYSTRGSRNCPL